MHPPSFEKSSEAVARNLADKFAAIPQVQAVAVSGSRTSPLSDADSDIDLYVYVTEPIPLSQRREIASSARRAEIGNETWEPGDEWVDGESGIPVDVMYRDIRWIRELLERVLVHYQASVGYSTCFWYNVVHSQALFDRRGWLAEMNGFCDQPYPPGLRLAILRKNYPILRRNQSSYLHQIELAIRRNDPVSVNHRITALLASYFDILFAINQLPHPGEKRLLVHAAKCRKLPQGMETDVRRVLNGRGNDIPNAVNTLLDHLDELLAREGMLPE